MSNHVWRQGHNISPFREWGRRQLPGSGGGMVIVDLDVAVRRYGKNFSLDEDGDLMIIEVKEFKGILKGGTRHVLNWLQRAMSSSKYSDRWRGVHLLRINYNEEIPICGECEQPIMSADKAYELFMSATLTLDKIPITHDELKSRLLLT